MMKALRKSIERFYLSILVISLCSVVLVLFIVVERLTLYQLDRELENIVTDLIKYLEEPSKEPLALFGKRDLGFQVTEAGKTIASFQMATNLNVESLPFGTHFVRGYRVLVERFGPYTIVIVKSTKQRTTLLLILGVSLLTTLVAIISAATFFGKKLINKLIKPIEDIGNQMDEVSKGLRERIEVKLTSDEVNLLQLQINEALSRLRRTMEELRNFASYLSHQLRNPLASAKAQIELMLSNSANENVQELKSVLKNLNKMVEITEGLLLLARIQHQKEASFVVEDMSTILMESLEQLMQRFPDVEFEIDSLAEVKFCCVKDLMEHVFVNLIENACKYSVGSNHVFVSLRTENNKIKFKVENFGNPIPNDESNKIFERFFQGSNKTGTGLGLGLSIVKAIVELHRGEVRYYHHDGKNVFEVTFNSPS